MYQDISDEAVQAAAAFVDADQFIQKLPEKYETKVTERGSSFSTGQRQLLAFARTVASLKFLTLTKRQPILILKLKPLFKNH